MADYISREAAIAVAERYGLGSGSTLGLHSGIADCIELEITHIPAADVEPVRHVCRKVWGAYEYYGEWMRCPRCRFNFNTVFAKFCGGCGAKMDLEDENGN